MYIKVAAGSNDKKTAYFSKINFEGNLLNENCTHILFNHSNNTKNLRRQQN